MAMGLGQADRKMNEVVGENNCLDKSGGWNRFVRNFITNRF